MSTTTGADTARDAIAELADGFGSRMGGEFAVSLSDLASVAWAMGWRPATRVITSDVPTVTAALDALPAGTVIRIVEEEEGPQVFEAVVAHGHYAPPIVWSSTRSPRLVDSGYIARGKTPVTVLWAGDAA